ncbi:MAG: outer membrane beta-barrel protein [Bacteroidota bacterium]
MLFATKTFSQNRLAPKAGSAISSLETTINGANITGNAGFVIGTDWRMEQGRAIFIQPGLFFQNINLDVNEASSSRITSLKLPATLGWYVSGRERLWVVNLRGGIVPEWISGVKEAESFNKDAINDFQWSGRVGLGVDIALLTVDVAYDFGLSNFSDFNEDKQQVTTITLGLIF